MIEIEYKGPPLHWLCLSLLGFLIMSLMLINGQTDLTWQWWVIFGITQSSGCAQLWVSERYRQDKKSQGQPK
jgi:hypothetical protein